MNKITVMCHKDHDKGYEDYVGKCLLCEIEKLQAQKQEPVAWMYPDALCDRACLYLCTKGFAQFPECATSPPQRQPLTDEQRMDMWRTTKFRGNGGQIDWFIEGTRAAEAAHGIKE